MYRTERFLRENGERVPSGVRSEVVAAVEELRAALASGAPDTNALREGVRKLAAVSQKVGQAMYQDADGTRQAGQEPREEDVEDAEVVDAEVVDDEVVDDEQGDGAPGHRRADWGGPAA